MDDATLAAFVDGRLDLLKRERVLRAMADSPELRSRVEEITYLREAMASYPDSEVVALSSNGRTRNGVRRLWVTAAAAVVVMGVAIALVRSRKDPVPMVLARVVSEDLPADGVWPPRRWGPDWDVAPFARARGGGGMAGEHVVAFEAGAQLVQLEVAAGAGDSVAVARIAAATGALLAQLPLGAPLAALAVQVSAGSRESRLNLARETRRAVQPDFYDLGGWVESLRLVTLFGDPAALERFLARRPSGWIPEATIQRVPEPLRERVARLREYLGATRSPDPSQLRPLLDSVYEAARE